MEGETLKGHLGSILLASLEEQPLHGYAVIESLRSRSHGAIDLPTGTVYPALHRLQRAGLIRSRWSTVAGRRRRTYELTKRGRRALTGERVAWQEFVTAISTLIGEPPAEAPT